MNGVETMANPVLLTWNATYGALETQMQLWRLVVNAFCDWLKPPSSESLIHLVRLRSRRQNQIAVIFVNGYF